MDTTFLIPIFGEEVSMTERRKSIPREVKLEAVRRVRERGESPGQVAHAYGVRADQVQDWVRKVEAASREGGVAGRGRRSLTSVEHEELKLLRRQVQALEQERDFLKKAAAYFAKESPDGTP